MPLQTMRIGFVVNPYAGMGGPLANKGSDNLVQQAELNNLSLVAPRRAQLFLQSLIPHIAQNIDWLTLDGPMGADLLASCQLRHRCVDFVAQSPSSALDTQQAAVALVSQGVDLLVFVGGDGTARDICAVLPQSQAVLGVPAGVKMQSAVYAITPQSAAQLIEQMLQGALVGIQPSEVRDIDEAALSRGQVKSRYFGQMLTPHAPLFVQHVKQGGLEVEDWVILDMAEHLRTHLPEDALIVAGPGSTTHAVFKEWGIDTTLMGVDVIIRGAMTAADVNAEQLEQMAFRATRPVYVVVTIIGGQGHIFGRGNQQITAKLLKQLGKDRVRVLATKTKLKTLAGRPLWMDTGDAELEHQWQGFISVICGFEDEVWYPLGLSRDGV